MYDTDTSYPEFDSVNYVFPHALDAMTDDEAEAYEYVQDVLWFSEDKIDHDYWLNEKNVLELKAKIKIYRTLLKALEAPYLEGVE